MKLLTKTVAKSLPPLYSCEDCGGDQAVAKVKFFTPWSGWTWYATEYDPEKRIFFGLVIGREAELGYFAPDEMEEVCGPYGLRIERDIHFRPASLAACKEKRL